MAAVAQTMQARTGRTLDEWVEVVQQSGIDPLEQNGVRRWLKAQHGVLQNSRWAIADAAARAAGWSPPDTDGYLDQQYAEPKAALRPIFERLREIAEGLGDDVSMEARGTYTSFVRRRQFAAIAPATRTRIDLGLRYTTPPDSALLIPSAAPGQATHKLSLASIDDVTSEVEQLMRIAYEQN